MTQGKPAGALVAVLGVLDVFLEKRGGERLLASDHAGAVQPRVVLDAHRRVAAVGLILLLLPARGRVSSQGLTRFQLPFPCCLLGARV